VKTKKEHVMADVPFFAPILTDKLAPHTISSLQKAENQEKSL
jgi:hypothetical protein